MSNTDLNVEHNAAIESHRNGGEHGIDFTNFPIKTLIGHSHPPGIVNALSASDLAITRSLRQRSSWLLENGVLRRFWLSDYP
ncbi:MAG: hypothetical protein LC753_08260 [Acidobacteria bacterium]|nr:hypothetical protein [Acidobacteriota bacterium]MCA1650265.1 hypothetical protein [Acidobacteriota bacterium]